MSTARVSHAGAAVRARVQLPTIPLLKHALKTGLAVGLAVWLARLAGLEDPYWAGISAAVVSNPNLGGSIGSALSRVGATVAGLALGLAALTLFGQGIVVGAVVVGVAVLVLPMIGITTGVRLGAATTLILTVYPATDELVVAVSRGLNIPLGSAVAVLVGLLVWPSRASRALRSRLRADVASVGVLARDALAGYAGTGSVDVIHEQVRAIEHAPAAHAALLRDATREPGAGAALQRQTDVAARLVAETITLSRAATSGAGDRAAELLAPQLLGVGDAIEQTTRTYADRVEAPAFAEAVGRAEQAVAALRAALDELRSRRGTVTYTSDELLHLLSTIQATQALVGYLVGLGQPEE
ncbi:hypothetical protein PSU4_07460 [Pseudonocardia sulfidoxydans NBRC 16205]|uniref:FUSC family protein n=1 Tax=Pseudonocardia sulfidoxydans NBRC 16205 TaxID=1223511 RepID=A0A511DAF8_9PSEU|nr:FUSC family protein [Pseudonocardia sulfidoxydans]GEL21792.1 hypothetical protein PSU4_07460 [Pseudonocardia sulfidoxydans NBRC 16205]